MYENIFTVTNMSHVLHVY